MPDQILITGDQTDELRRVLASHDDGGQVLLTQQGDGKLVVAFDGGAVRIGIGA